MSTSSSGDTTLYLVRPETLDQAWPEVEKLVREVAGVSLHHTAESIRELVASGRWQLFIAKSDHVEVICLTEIRDYPKARFLDVYVCHGNIRARWLKHLETIEKWAVAQGCQYIQPYAPPGWERVLKPYGYTSDHRLLLKRLSGNTVAQKTQ